MTLAQLAATPWNCMRDYPKVGIPWRAPRLAYREFHNQHGVPMSAAVLTNRTRKRFWLEILIGQPDQRSIQVYRTTTSARKAAEWTSALEAAQ